MECPGCRNENPAQAKFCLECGTPLALRCVKCLSQLPPSASFCLECGEPIAGRPAAEPRFDSPDSYTPKHLAKRILTSRSALEGERKQVTVLFADVAGFSTLAERLDPEAVHVLMDGCFQFLTRNVHRYEGTVNQFTGDGIMALFGAPITHEDHAVRALQAALDIQADLAGYAETVQRQWRVPFQMRLGINTGPVVVARIGDNLRMDYTAQGDTTNLAARLQQMAPPGAIWVGQSTYRVAAGAFEWQPIGTVTVKGRETPVGTYELLDRRALRSRFEAQAQRGLTRLVAREAEFEQLLAAWESARQSGGRVVSVVGEAGLGKSRLLYEFKERLAREGAQYLEGSCFAYGDSISYLPFLEIVKTFFGLDANKTEADAKRQIAGRLATLELEPSEVVPYLQNLLTYAVEDEMFGKLPPHLVRERTVTALKILLLGLAAQQPLVLIIEDVHWIDSATEEALGALVDGLSSVPLLLLLIYRPEYLHAWATKPYHARIDLGLLPGASSAEMVRAILQKPYASRVALKQLTAEQSSALIQGMLGTTAIPPELERLVVANTEGNPLFIEELTLSLLESGELVPGNGGYVLRRPLDAPSLPTTVQGVLLARIDRLTDELKAVLQVAAVVGRVFTHAVLARAIGGGAEIDQALPQLENLEFIYPTQLAPQREYSFKHALTQQAVYDSLLRPRREALHERVGCAIETLYPDRLEQHYELLAYHYARSANAEKAVEYLDAANQKAIKVNAMVEARAYFEEAMRQLDSLPDSAASQHRRVALLVRQVNVFVLTFQMEEFFGLLTRYEELATRVNDRALLGRFYACLGHCHWFFGRFDEALKVHTPGVRLSEAEGDWEGAAHHYMQMMWDYLCTGEFGAAVDLAPHARRCLDRGFNLRWCVYALGGESLSNAWLGRWQRAVEVGEEALAAAKGFSDNGAICFAGWILAMAHASRGALAEAFEIAAMAVEKGPTPGDKAWAQCVLAWVRMRTGDPRKAVELLAPVVSMSRGARFLGVPFFEVFLIEGYWLAGEYDKATRAAEEMLQIAERCRMRFVIAAGHRLLAEIAVSVNSPETAGEVASTHFERAITALQDLEAEPELALAYAGYGRLHKRQGQMHKAQACLSRALEISERLGTLIEPDKISAELTEMRAS